MSLTETSDRFTALPDEHTLAATVVALEEHGFSVEVVDDLDAARQAVLARIPHGASVMTNTSMTLTQAGIDDAINDGGSYDSARNKMAGLDFATQLQEMTLSYVPKLLVSALVLIALGPWMIHRITQFATSTILLIPSLG